MIDLLTGLPGNAKTLYCIQWISERAKNEGREVYYSGIPFTEKGKQELGWKEIDPTKWNECPPNSIVVIDEAQRIFRNRSINSQPPKYVSDLETHRHLGIDLLFITQMPKLIDPGVRALTQRHRHMVRIFGMEASTVHEWSEVRDDCHKGARRKDSEKTKWVFARQYYDYYKSAEAHTMKRSIPKRVWLLVLVPLAILAAVFAVKKLLLKPPAVPPPSAAASAPGAGVTQNTNNRPVFDPVADAREYVYKQTPRVHGLQFTAPKYDAITEPTTAPVPSACVQAHGRCECFSQQATRMDVTYAQCVKIVQFGYFQEFDPRGRQAEDVTAQASGQVRRE